MRRFVVLAGLFLLAGACGDSGGADVTAPTVLTTEAVATTTEAVATTTQETNVFASSSGDLRSCFLRTLGPEILEELADGRQPTPEEEMRLGPCMNESQPGSGDEGIAGGGEGEIASQPLGQPSNLFASASPELRECIIRAVGQEVFERLARGAQPTPEEGAEFGPCLGTQIPNSAGVGQESSDSSSCIPEDPTGYGRPSRDFLLGIKAFQLQPGNQSVSNAADIKALGMNTVSLSFQIPFDEGGYVRYPFSSFGTSHPTLQSSLCHIGNLVHELKSAGLSIYLSGEPIYYAVKPGVVPPALASSIIPTYVSELGVVMAGLAETAERYQVDWLAPISEPDKYFGSSAADEFMQDIRPTFNNFNGKLVWQIYGSDQRLDLRGFDIAGLAVLGCDVDGIGGMFDTYISEVVAWAEADGVSEVAHVEFGCVGSPQDISTAKTNFDRWYKSTSAFATGLIVLDEPASAPNAQQVVGTWLEEWVVGIAGELGLDQ